jgi:hydrogenase-4 component B
MQYTASSFADTIAGLFAWVLRPERHEPALDHSISPSRASWSSHVPDAFLDYAIVPAARGVGWAFGKLHWFQRGSLHTSLLYVLLALLLAFLVL